MIFTINAENNISAFATAKDVENAEMLFSALIVKIMLVLLAQRLLRR